MAYIKHTMISDIHARRLIAQSGNSDIIDIVDEKTDQRMRSRCLDLDVQWEGVPKMDAPDEEVPESDSLKAWGEAVWLTELFQSVMGGTNIDDIYMKKIKMYTIKSQDLRREVTKETILSNFEDDFSNRSESIPVY